MVWVRASFCTVLISLRNDTAISNRPSILNAFFTATPHLPENTAVSGAGPANQPKSPDGQFSSKTMPTSNNIALFVPKASCFCNVFRTDGETPANPAAGSFLVMR
jgi:hypothetical protein